jgi:hypothetical protein
MALNDNIPYQYNKPQIKVDFDFDYKSALAGFIYSFGQHSR